MSSKTTSGFKSRMAAGIAGAALVVGVPSAGLAVGFLGEDGTAQVADSFSAFTPAAADPRLARMIETRSGSKTRMMRFTPAGTSGSGNRAVTVAVRVDDESVQAISVRNAIISARDNVAEAQPRISPSRYNLGIARGYRRFAQAPAISQPLSAAAIPDLSEFEPTTGIQDAPNRFAARIALEEGTHPASSGAQTLDSISDQSLDVVGSYRLTRNLDVTAGVRYEQDRDGLSPLTSIEQQDSQAVYIGTQFRF